MTKELNIHQRLAAAMSVVQYIQKDPAKQGMNYATVSHDKVTASVRPALLDAGIVYYPIKCQHTQSGNRAECGMTIRFVNIDKPEDCFDVETFGYGVDNQDKGPGKAMSYAVKYALLKTMGLETGDDPDHQSIDHGPDPATRSEMRDRLKAAIMGQKTENGLNKLWSQATFQAEFDKLPAPMQGELNKAKADKGDELAGEIQ